MQWSNEMWTAVIVAFFVGAVVGYLILLTTNANAKKQQKLEVDLEAATQQINEQKQHLEKHFEQSAQLLATIAEDYKKLYSHLAQSSQALLPEAADKLEFFQQAQLENTQAEAVTTAQQTASETLSDDTATETEATEKTSHTSNEQAPPKDYTEGSSGILKS